MSPHGGGRKLEHHPTSLHAFSVSKPLLSAQVSHCTCVLFQLTGVTSGAQLVSPVDCTFKDSLMSAVEAVVGRL